MRRIFLFTFLSFLTSVLSFGQTTSDQTIIDEKININDIKLKNSNEWGVGGGLSNFIMHGDLRSIGTGTIGNFYNFGGYIYVNKMFNPLLGFEIKASYNNISGGSQYLSDIYEVLYLPNTVVRNGVTETINREKLFFEGNTFGLEANLILSFSNLYYKVKATKWHAAGYFGAGYHFYNSALFEKLDDGSNFAIKDADFGRNPERNSENRATSIYLSAQLGIKRKISNRLDLEIRSGMYFNYEDHLDAAISSKQNWETFFVTSLGVSLKLGKMDTFTIWEDREKVEDFDKLEIIDTDKDGVMNQLDKEPNTPLGVMVYGNGKAVDSDNDTIPDYKDKCPLKYGSIENLGCPTEIDTDGDGILDKDDLCPTIVGPKEKKGCPEEENKNDIQNVTQQIALLATSIYFDTNSHKIKVISLNTLDKIGALMKSVPDSKFMIEGHTDKLNSDKYNLYLSNKRVYSVKKYLLEKGVESNRLMTKGYGETRPKYSNETAGGRQLNRRVEINPVNDFDEVITDVIVDDINELENKATHTIVKNDTLYSISKKYGLTVKKLMELNNLKTFLIKKGQVLKVK